jgi:hypothetical protein
MNITIFTRFVIASVVHAVERTADVSRLSKNIRATEIRSMASSLRLSDFGTRVFQKYDY